jgi:hypothetical protein
MDEDELAVQAFKIFHEFNLDAETDEEARINLVIAHSSAVYDVARLCPHCLVGVASLVRALVKLQAADQQHKH